MRTGRVASFTHCFENTDVMSEHFYSYAGQRFDASAIKSRSRKDRSLRRVSRAHPGAAEKTIQMAGHTMATAAIDYTATEGALNTTGLLFKFYRDHFGTVSLPVDGNSPG